MAATAASSTRAVLKPIRRVYVFYGEDDTRKDEWLTQLRDAVVDPAFADFDCEVLDADTTPVESILAAAGMAPFGSTHRLVIVRRAEIYRKREKQGEAERLAQGIEGLGGSSCLALRVAAAEEERSRGKTIVTAKLDAAIRAHGAAVECGALTGHDMLAWLTSEAQKSGKRLDERAGERLIQAARGDRTALANELEKAVCYAGDAPFVSLDAVEATCSYDPEDVMFKLVDAVSQRNADRGLRLLHELLRYDNKPQAVAGRLLALLGRQFKLLWQAHELAARRIDPGSLRNLPADITAQLPSDAGIASMAWKARDLFALGRRWSREGLAQAFELLIECDMANKGGDFGSEDAVTNLELLIVKLSQLP